MVEELVPKSSADLTLGADAGYDTSDLVAACRERGITPHHRADRLLRISRLLPA
jgi:IS5 family transposase